MTPVPRPAGILARPPRPMVGSVNADNLCGVKLWGLGWLLQPGG